MAMLIRFHKNANYHKRISRPQVKSILDNLNVNGFRVFILD